MRTGGTANEWKVVPLAAASVDVFKSPDPGSVYLGNPSIATMPGGRIVVSADLAGPGVKRLPGAKGRHPATGHWLLGKVFVSGDKGKTWASKLDFPFHEARLFRLGSTLYLMGLAGTLRIVKSPDGGDTWNRMEELEQGDGEFIQAPSNVLQAADGVYVLLLKTVAVGERGEGGRAPVPVVLRARQGSDLTSRKNWAWSEPGKPFHELVPPGSLDFLGLPASRPPDAPGDRSRGGRRPAGRIEWDASHIVQIRDSRHGWQDPKGRTFHLVARAESPRSNLAAFARMVEDEAGRMAIDLESLPGGGRIPLLPLPGGNLKFDVAYDEESKLFWLVSNLVSDSLARPEQPSQERRGASAVDRQRLQLHFSRNLVDWSFAAFVDSGAEAKELRHSPVMAIAGGELYIVCCSGHPGLGAQGYTDRITFHTIPAFRELVY